MMKVSKLQNMDEQLLNAICDYLKPVLYIERSFIVQEGEPLDEMVFIIRGKVMIYSKRDGESGADSSESKWLTKGDFYGEGLLDWALQNPTSATVPISTKTIRAHSKVEVFVLMANDLKTVLSKFWWLFSKNSPSMKAMCAPWAALALQLAWRRYCKSKREKKIRSPELATEGKNPPEQNIAAPARVSVLASRYIVRALCALKKKVKKTRADQTSRV